MIENGQVLLDDGSLARVSVAVEDGRSAEAVAEVNALRQHYRLIGRLEAVQNLAAALALTLHGRRP